MPSAGSHTDLVVAELHAQVGEKTVVLCPRLGPRVRLVCPHCAFRLLRASRSQIGVLAQATCLGAATANHGDGMCVGGGVLCADHRRGAHCGGNERCSACFPS